MICNQHSVIKPHCSFISKHKWCGDIPPNKQGQTASHMETIIIASLKQKERKTIFCGMSVGLTAPEEHLRDQVCFAIIRQEGFQKMQHTDQGETCWQLIKKGGACVSIQTPHQPWFSAPLKLLARYFASFTPNTQRRALVVDIEARWNEAHH